MKNFIKARLNRDNFWNLMLWLGMSLGWAIGIAIKEAHSTISASMFWLTLFGVPYLIKKANKLNFDKEKGFLSEDGRSLKTSYPRNILAIIFLTFLLFPLECLISNGLASTLSLFLLTPTLYFIIKNCPITILFYKKAWCEEVTGIRQMTQEEAAGFNSIGFKSQRGISKSIIPNYGSSPKYSYLSSNTYHRR